MKTLFHLPFLGQLILGIYRAKISIKPILGLVGKWVLWLIKSRETTNYTYDLTDINKKSLISFVAHITGKSFLEVSAYVSEIENNNELKKHIQTIILTSDEGYKADKEVKFGKRLAWYALCRAVKPKIVVETGVDKGLGACVLTAALMKNAEEGYPGYYYGTDINPKAGYLLQGKYAQYGEILFGDSIESLNKFDKKIDLFINDSDHFAEYEYKEYLTISSKLTKNGIIIGDNAHTTDKLLSFSQQTNREFLFFAEQPLNHWYPGGGLGVSFQKN